MSSTLLFRVGILTVWSKKNKKSLTSFLELTRTLEDIQGGTTSALKMAALRKKSALTFATWEGPLLSTRKEWGPMFILAYLIPSKAPNGSNRAKTFALPPANFHIVTFQIESIPPIFLNFHLTMSSSTQKIRSSSHIAYLIPTVNCSRTYGGMYSLLLLNNCL